MADSRPPFTDPVAVVRRSARLILMSAGSTFLAAHLVGEPRPFATALIAAAILTVAAIACVALLEVVAIILFIGLSLAGALFQGPGFDLDAQAGSDPTDSIGRPEPS